jgi:endonuclease/exonuclease/phosphatase family metal-dependent hydrolase
MGISNWQFLSEVASLDKNVILCGDFNSKAKSLVNASSNKQVEDLEKALVPMELMCIYSGRITRIANRPGDEDSAIDLTFVFSFLTAYCLWSVLEYCGSDHFQCSFLVSKGKPKKLKHKGLTFRYDCT